MKKNIKIILSLGLFIIITKNSFSQSEIIGIWLTQDKEAKVQIYKSGVHYYGKIIWLKKPKDEIDKPVLDDNNPKIELKKRQLMNLTILNGFLYEGKEWVGGTLYDPTDGNTYNCKMWLETSGSLKVRGYLGFLYETESWIRVKEMN